MTWLHTPLQIASVYLGGQPSTTSCCSTRLQRSLWHTQPLAQVIDTLRMVFRDRYVIPQELVGNLVVIDAIIEQALTP